MTCLHRYLQHTSAYLKLKMKKKNKYIQPLIVTVILEDDAGGGLMAGSPAGEGQITDVKPGEEGVGNGDVFGQTSKQSFGVDFFEDDTDTDY